MSMAPAGEDSRASLIGFSSAATDYPASYVISISAAAAAESYDLF